MEDSDWEIRAESIEGIRKQHVIKAIPELESLLKRSHLVGAPASCQYLKKLWRSG